MHVLLLLARVPVPAECERSSVDSDWLLALASHHDLVVAVDENTAGCDALRDAGITVHVSDRRHVYLPGDERVDADTALANWLANHHADRPFDLVAASSERPAFGPVRDAMHGVPWTVLAACGPTSLARRLGLDQAWLSDYADELWHAASNVATADIVLTPVAPDVLGLDVGRRRVATLLPVPEPQLAPRVTGELVAVLATGVAHATATEAVEAALAVIDIHPATTVIVVHTPPVAGAMDLAPALAAGVPAELEHQVVLVPNERHGRAGEWLTAADALVLADASELLIPAVARRAALVPTAVLGPTPAGRARIRALLTSPRVAPGPSGVELLPWSRPSRLATDLRRLRRTSTAQMVVVHDEAATTEATRWTGMDALSRFDVVVGATERPPWSMVNPHRLHGGLVGLHRRTWNAVADEVERLGGLPDLVALLADPAGGRSHTLGAITVRHEPGTITAPGADHRTIDLLGGPLPHLRPPQPGWAQPVPMTARHTPRPAVALQTWAREARWPTRARLALPWRLGLADAVREGEFPDGVASWAKHHTITDRARLLLPWKWGLLPRAMEGRW